MLQTPTTVLVPSAKSLPGPTAVLRGTSLPGLPTGIQVDARDQLQQRRKILRKLCSSVQGTPTRQVRQRGGRPSIASAAVTSVDPRARMRMLFALPWEL